MESSARVYDQGEPFSWRMSTMERDDLFQVYFAQDVLCMNEYHVGLQPRYVEINDHVLSCATTLQPHPVRGLMMMVMTLYIDNNCIQLESVSNSNSCLFNRSLV